MLANYRKPEDLIVENDIHVCHMVQVLKRTSQPCAALHKFAKYSPSRVKCRLRGCSSMVEQKLPKPLHLVKSHCSCGSEAHESAITTKRHLNQQVTCHHIFDPTSSRKSC